MGAIPDVQTQALSLVERLLQIGDDVVLMLDAERETDIAPRGNAQLQTGRSCGNAIQLLDVGAF